MSEMRIKASDELIRWLTKDDNGKSVLKAGAPQQVQEELKQINETLRKAKEEDKRI